ncbi:DUF6297 family protein [Luedemannella helvata]|uniref:ABC transporter permease n=1 Tax=Luedemannella helvata TaxID=349315 RepID=A0ABP4VVW5_9ACTN
MTAAPAGIPSARHLRADLRAARRAHRTGGLGDVLSDLYVVALFLGMYSWAAIYESREYLRSPTAGHTDPDEVYWIAVAAVPAALAFAWHGLRTVGPLLVTPTMQAWVTSSPVDRRALLAPRFRALGTGMAALVAALGGAAALIGGAPATGLAWGALAGAACGAGGVSLSVLAQATRGRRRWPRLVGVALAIVAALVAASVVVAHFSGGSFPRPAGSLTVVVAIAGLPLAVVALVIADRALRRVDRAALTAGAPLANAAAEAVVLLDPTLLAGLLEGRRWRRVGRVRSRRFLPGGRWWVLLQAEVRRLYRSPGALVAWGALILLQYAVAVAVPSVAGPARVIGAFLAATRLTGGLRTLTRSPGLRRAVGGGNAAVRLVHLVVPAAGAGLWWLATAPVGPVLPAWATIGTLLGVVFAAYRAATRAPLDYGGAYAVTPFGTIPVDLLRQLLRGPDVIAVLVLVSYLLT